MENKDYVNPADGLLYCGKCHTKKQCRVTAFGRETTPYCICECEKKRLAEEKAERKQQQTIADKRRRENISRSESQKVDLLLELSDGTRGHIQGSISSRK